MINDLLDVTRLQMKRPLELDRQPTDLVALVRRVATELQATTERHQIRVEADTPEVVGEWDSARLERVVTNLVSNAVKYSPGGGEVTLAVERENGDALLRVRDRGMGIPKDEMLHVFERFYRADPARPPGGAGLGLAIARWIAEEHGGAITVESRPGQGSVFAVELPAVA